MSVPREQGRQDHRVAGSEAPHPLLSAMLRAAAGNFPHVDGGARLLPGLSGGQQAVVSFTGHALIASHRPHAELAGLRLDGYGAALAPQVLQHLAGSEGSVGSLDVTLVAVGRGGGRLPARPDLLDHPRVRHARAHRRDVRVFGDDRGLVTLARGLAGRPELSIEVATGQRGAQVGRALLSDALALVPAGTAVFAAVAPGNARSLRAFLAAGFRPLASEVLITGPDGRP